MSLIANNSTDPDFVPDDLIVAGDVRTASAVLSAGVAVRGTPLARITATGAVVLWDPAGADGSENAIGIAVHPVDSADAPANCPYYYSGGFNTNTIAWPAATAAEKAGAFDGTAISVSNPPV